MKRTPSTAFDTSGQVDQQCRWELVPPLSPTSPSTSISFSGSSDDLSRGCWEALEDGTCGGGGGGGIPCILQLPLRPNESTTSWLNL